MITKIDIVKFGLFNNYQWETVIGRQEEFKKLNIIYGRNYSGKTTLSRIFKCIEDKQIHKKYSDCNFKISFRGGKIVTQNNILEEVKQSVRVYNTDFVRENLSWLHNDDGTIKPFTILGAKNVELDKKIQEIEEKLGSVEVKDGLLFQLNKINEEYINSKKLYSKLKSELDNKLKNKAQNIKVTTNIYNVPLYQINSIKDDIKAITPNSILSDEQIDAKKKLLKEEAKELLIKLPESKPKFSSYYSDSLQLLSKKIQPSKPISDLINDSLLQAWVRQGMEKNKDRDLCAFCRNPLSEEIWHELNAHFSQESEHLRIEIQNQINLLNKVSKSLEGYITLTKNDFYSNLYNTLEDINKKWKSTSKIYLENINILISKLKDREEDIFKEKQIEEINDISEDILEIIKQYNALIELNNNITSTLSVDQNVARKELRISEVAQFITDIDYTTEINEINSNRINTERLEKEKSTIEQKIEILLEDKRELEAQAKDESKGAELANKYLTHFFGHNELKLVAEGENPNIKFRIIRDESEANNLSEGECSLISFCYFIAKIEDEMRDEVTSANLIIYIDDPISSLDSNHIFFMFSLIESVIAKDKKYGQLFISTHNLNFLKYLKNITKPKKDYNYFIIERKGKNFSELKMSPIYLKDYVTEFNYLFDQVYKCSISDKETITYNYQYNFGNNTRKFLEAYLFYKYPNQNLTLDQRVNRFFEDDPISKTLVNRVVNEYSHLGEHFDRGLIPIDVDEISKVANIIIEKIKVSDESQFSELVKSVSDIIL